MLDRRTKRQIEWAFRNYNANKALGAAQVAEIAESGITVDFERITCGGSTGSPTESKALKLCERAKQYLWAKVVENTMTAFRFDAVYDVLVDAYFLKKRHRDIMIEREVSESTYFYWLDKALNFAYMWVDKFELL